MIFSQKPLDKAFQMWYNTLVVKGEHPQPLRKKIKKILKNFQKTLDKPFKIWYNKCTKGKGERNSPTEKKLKKIKKSCEKHLTNKVKCDII